MTSSEVALLVGAVAALIGALQGWLVSRSNQHEALLNGKGEARITELANQAIIEYRAGHPKPATAAPLTPAQTARLAALKAELATLEPAS